MLRALKQRVYCLDFENTLVPEFWPIVADRTGVKELKITSQDLPNQRELMNHRIDLLQRHDIRMPLLLSIAGKEKPLPGAVEFIRKISKHSPRIIIVSDFAVELAQPLVDQFPNLVFFGHQLMADSDGRIIGYEFRQQNPKLRVVEAMKHLNFEIFAVGDSYNDIIMLEYANQGFFINAPDKIQEEFPQFKNAKDYDELYDWLTA